MSTTSDIPFGNVCRTCMSKEDELEFQSIDVPLAGTRIVELLNLLTPFSGHMSPDEMPKKICPMCVKKVTSVHEFQQMCIQTQYKLRRLIEEAKFLLDHETPATPAMFEQDLSVSAEGCDPLKVYDLVEVKMETCEEVEQKLEEPKPAEDDGHASDVKVESEEDQSHSAKKSKAAAATFDCDLCSRSFPKKSSLKCHKYRHKINPQMKIRDRKRTAKLPNGKSKDDKDEPGEADPGKPHKCEYCQKAFQQCGTLKDHIRTHTGEQPFLCSECGKAFSSSSNMKQHLLRHAGVKRYECPSCPKKFPCLSDLASHKAVHSKVKPHVCDICGACFGKPYQLRTHKMYHNGEKPHKCEYCEMRFVMPDHMRRHMRTHTGEKPYKCKYCERAFAQSNDLIKHLRSHLGDNVYKCELCPKGFRLATELRTHFSEHKDDDDETRAKNLKALEDDERNIIIRKSV